MSIASEINNYANGLSDAYDAVSDMSGIIPQDKNMNNLDSAIRTIPVGAAPNDGVLTITQNGTTIQTFSANQSTNVTAALTDTTYSDMTGATSGTAGTSGLVPAPASGDEGKVLHGDGTWKDATAKLVEMSYGESNAWAKFIAAYNAGSIVYCRASSNANPGSGSQTRKAFMAYVNNATSPTSVEFQYVRSNSSKTDSNQCDQVFVYTLTNANGGTWSVASRDMAPKILVDSTLNKTFSGGANASVTLGAKAMTGATSSTAGTAGYVPTPAAGDEGKFLKGDGTWATVPGGTAYTAGTGIDITGTSISASLELEMAQEYSGVKIDLVDADSYSVLTSEIMPTFTPASSYDDGNSGLVPAPAAGDEGKFLQGNGTWATVSGGATLSMQDWNALFTPQVVPTTDFVISSVTGPGSPSIVTDSDCDYNLFNAMANSPYTISLTRTPLNASDAISVTVAMNDSAGDESNFIDNIVVSGNDISFDTLLGVGWYPVRYIIMTITCGSISKTLKILAN